MKYEKRIKAIEDKFSTTKEEIFFIDAEDENGLPLCYKLGPHGYLKDENDNFVIDWDLTNRCRADKGEIIEV